MTRLQEFMQLQVTDQPMFAVAGFLQHTKEGTRFAMVTCDPNELVAPIHPKAMITILKPEDHGRWIPRSLDDVIELQRSYADCEMTVRGPTFLTRER